MHTFVRASASLVGWGGVANVLVHSLLNGMHTVNAMQEIVGQLVRHNQHKPMRFVVLFVTPQIKARVSTRFSISSSNKMCNMQVVVRASLLAAFARTLHASLTLHSVGESNGLSMIISCWQNAHFYLDSFLRSLH